jgi:hypothetical protein
MAIPLLAAAGALPWKTILKWGAVAAVLIGIAVIGYRAVSSYNAALTNNAILESNNEQLLQNIKDKEDYIDKMNQLQEATNNILAQTEARNNVVVERHSQVTEYIQSPEAQASNRESSDVIKNTIRMLRDEE